MALDDGAEVCAETSTADEAIALAERHQPDVCLIGHEVHGGEFAALSGIVSVSPGTAVVVLADSPDSDDLLACVRAGAVGYVPSRIGPAPLRRVVSAVANGQAAIPRPMVLELVRELQDGPSRRAVGLTAREAQVLAMLRRGHPTATIARKLGISPVTVRRHISATMHKTGSDDRTALTRGGTSLAWHGSKGTQTHGLVSD